MGDGLADSERNGLCDLMVTLGPSAPTLCEGWSVHHLAAHLRLRETDMVAAGGMFVPALAGFTERRMARLMAEVDFDVLVEEVRRGPKAPNPFAIPAVDERLNALEFFVHHEDVRRGGPNPAGPRVLTEQRDDYLWEQAISLSRMRLRRTRFGVLLQRVVDGFTDGDLAVVSTGRSPVTVRGEAGELVLWLYGRGTAALVEFSGPDAQVEALRTKQLGI